jgi:hypothetical protein
MRSLSQCHPEDSTVEVLKTTVLLFSSTAVGLWWGPKVLSTWSCVVHQRLCSGKITDLLKQMAAVFLPVYSLLPHHNLGKYVTVRHCANSWWYIWALHCPLFLLGNPFLNRRLHTSSSLWGDLSAHSIQWALQMAWNILCDSPKCSALMTRLCSTCAEPSSCPGRLCYNTEVGSLYHWG